MGCVSAISFFKQTQENEQRMSFSTVTSGGHTSIYTSLDLTTLAKTPLNWTVAILQILETNMISYKSFFD